MGTDRPRTPPAERRVHLDFHTPDFVENVGKHFDADRFTDVLAAGDVQQAAFFAKCHYGNAYYPTKIGREHPGLTCDMLGRFVEAAATRGIRTFAYYSLQLDQWVGRQHPEEVQHAEPFAQVQCGHWTPVCVSGPYAGYAREQLTEIASAYDIAGVWLDIVGYYPFCVCANCREAYQRATGRPLPFDESKPEDGVGDGFLDWQRCMLDDYTNGIARLLDKIRPGCELLCNTASGIREKAGGQTNQLDGQWCEEAVGNRPVSLSSVSLYSGLFDGAAEPRPFEILTQRFHMGWGDWTIRPLEALQYDAATILAHGGLVSIGDQLYGDGSFEPLVYERIGDTFHWLKPRQTFCGATANAAEIAVFAEPGGFRRDPGAIKYDSLDCRNSEGLFKVMLDAHCPTAVLSNLNALGAGRTALLLVDDNVPDTDEGVAALTNFVESGGKLVAVGIGPERYWPLLGVSDATPLPTPVSYVCMKERTHSDFAMPVLARIQGQGVTLAADADVLAHWAHPICEQGEEVFYSHQHAPPGPPTDEPAVWRVARGAGSVVGIAAPIATDYWHTSYPPLRHIIMDCVDRLLDGRRQVTAKGITVATEVTLRRGGNSLFVHLVVPSVSRPGIRADGETFYIDEAAPLHGVRITLRLPEGRRCATADQLGRPLTVEPGEHDGYVRATLEPFKTHTVVRFDLTQTEAP